MRFHGLLKFLVIFGLPIGILCFNSDVLTNEIPDVDRGFPRLEGRIVNGSKAALLQFPHQVSLRRSYSNAHFCGGSIIDAEWVLTAAHCMYKKSGIKIFPWSITVTAGHLRLNENESYVQSHGVSAIILHKNFSRVTFANDIALLKMKTPFNLTTAFVKSAELETKMPKPGTVCQVSGWGYLSEDKLVVSNDLMYVDLPLINPIRCRELLVNVTDLPLGMFCAGYEEGLRDACQGDSGGGMICGKTLTGVVSAGEGCARPAFPGLYSDVPYYRNWVTYQMRNYNQTSVSPPEPVTVSITPKQIGRSGSAIINSSLLLTNIFAIYSLLSFC